MNYWFSYNIKFITLYIFWCMNWFVQCTSYFDAHLNCIPIICIMFSHFLFQYFSQLPHKSSFNPKMFNPPSIFILNDKELWVPSNQSSFNPITKFLTQQQFINIRNRVVVLNQSINHCFKHELAIHMSVDIKRK